jgi:hypothetical protein
MTNVKARTLLSASVVHANTPSRTYTPNAMDKRFKLVVPSLSLGISPAGSRSAPARKTAQHWCTGEDSNLRSSQGAADLQSAAINHSATCAIPLLLASASLPRTIAELALTSLHASAGAQRKIIRRRVNILPHKGSLHVGRIPLRSAFLVILLR